MQRVLVPWHLVRVFGPSMVPTLTSGDLVLVLRGTHVRPGDVVLARFKSLAGREVIKRAHHREGDGWHLRSDNEFAGGDSRTHGPADVLARAVLVWPAGDTRARQLRPRRLARGEPS